VFDRPWLETQAQLAALGIWVISMAQTLLLLLPLALRNV
jgi:hypothetical protein